MKATVFLVIAAVSSTAIVLALPAKAQLLVAGGMTLAFMAGVWRAVCEDYRATTPKARRCGCCNTRLLYDESSVCGHCARHRPFAEPLRVFPDPSPEEKEAEKVRVATKNQGWR